LTVINEEHTYNIHLINDGLVISIQKILMQSTKSTLIKSDIKKIQAVNCISGHICTPLPTTIWCYPHLFCLQSGRYWPMPNASFRKRLLLSWTALHKDIPAVSS